MAIKGRRATFEERVSACEAIERGASPDTVAEVMNVARSSVFNWWKAYRERGKEALRNKSAPGRRASLTDGQLSQLRRVIVDNNPRQLGFGQALWTRGIIRELIQRMFGVTLSLVSVGRVLEKLGLSPQRPLYRAYERDPEKAAEWQEETFPRIQARAKKEDAGIFFADESSVRTDYHAGTTWAPVGHTPIVEGTGKKRSVSMVSAVSPRGELHFAVHGEGIDRYGFLEFTQKLVEDAGRPVFLIMDNSTVHHAKVLKEFAEKSGGILRLYFLPPYSPDLNPDEWVWKNVKNDDLGRASARSEGELMEFARAALERLKAAPGKVRSFFADPALKYIRGCGE